MTQAMLILGAIWGGITGYIARGFSFFGAILGLIVGGFVGSFFSSFPGLSLAVVGPTLFFIGGAVVVVVRLI